MKLDYKHWLLIAGIVILSLLSLKNCSGEEKTTITVKDKEVKIPEVTGGFKKPNNINENPISEPDTIFLGQPIYLPSPLEESVLNELKQAKDSLSRYRVLADAARKREYSSDFEDDNVKINVKSTVFGKLDNNEIKYTRKEIKTTVKETLVEKTVIKKDNWGILVLGGANKNLDTQKQNYQIGAGVRLGTISILGTATTDKTVGLNAIIEF